MAFKIFLMHTYGLLQIYVVAFRSTTTLKALRHLFLVGALSCLPVAIFCESIVRYYFQDSTHLVGVFAGIEELAKALPVLYLMLRTRVGMASSPLDGLLYGAAVGAGFGFGEDAIHMVENASINYYNAPDITVPSIFFSWLPGGWANGYAWFPGHMILTAVVGAGVGLGRRVFASRSARIVPTVVALGWMTFIHASYNAPTNPSVPSLSNFLFYQLNGGGKYLALMLTVLIFVLHVVDELYIRRISVRDGVPGPSVFKDLAQIVEGFGYGWRQVVRLRNAQRCEEELVQLHWEIGHLRSMHKPGPSDEIARETLMQERAEPQLHERTAARSFWSLKGLNTWEIIYRVAAIVVMAYGFWLVFLSPSFEHRPAVEFSATATITIVSIIGQILMFWRFASFLRWNRNVVDPSRSSALLVLRCQTMLIWSGCLTCMVALKELYDAQTFPYPLRAGAADGAQGKLASVHAEYTQLRACYGASTVPKTTPGFEAPVLALAVGGGKIIVDMAKAAGPALEPATVPVLVAEAEATMAGAATAGVFVAAGASLAVGPAMIVVKGPEMINAVGDEMKRIADEDVGEGTPPGGAGQQGESDAGIVSGDPFRPSPPSEPFFPAPGESYPEPKNPNAPAPSPAVPPVQPAPVGPYPDQGRRTTEPSPFKEGPAPPKPEIHPRFSQPPAPPVPAPPNPAPTPPDPDGGTPDGGTPSKPDPP